MTRRSIPPLLAVTTALTLVGALTAIAPASAATSPPAQAPVGPPPLTCGSVITTDTTLDGDLVCPDGAGLVLQGDVTLDLAGHALVGPGSGTVGAVAVRIDDASEVTLVGGVVTGWATAVAAAPEDDSLRPTVHVRRMVFRDVGTAVDAGWRATVDIDRSRFERLTVGVFGYNASVTVTASTFDGATGGVEGVEGALVRVTGSTFTGAETAVRCGSATCELSGDTFRGSTTAVDAWYGSGSVQHSLFTGNDRAVHLAWESDLTVTANVFRGNVVGVEVGVLDTSVVRRNVFSRNGTGIRTQSVDDGPGTSTTLEQNLVTRNGDGILADQPGVQLRANAALHNDGWGIHVVGAVDLGGNVARGNGQHPQCVGVACGSTGSPVS